MIRVVLPVHLRTLANIDGEVRIDDTGVDTQGGLLDVLESRYPMLRGAIRDQTSMRRRPFVRFFACGEDLSHDGPAAVLPDAVRSGQEPFVVLGAMAGG